MKYLLLCVFLCGCSASFTKRFNMSVAAYQVADEVVTAWYVSEDRRCTNNADYEGCMLSADVAVDLVDEVYLGLKIARTELSLKSVCSAVAGTLPKLAQYAPKKVVQAIKGLSLAVCGE